MTQRPGTDIAPTAPARAPLGWWMPENAGPTSDPGSARSLLGALTRPVAIVQTPDGLAVAPGGRSRIGGPSPSPYAYPLLAFLPPLTPADLGDLAFLTAHGLKYPYMTGAMANGIGSVELVEAVSRGGMLGSFGAAGLSIERIGSAIDQLKSSLGQMPFCVNLIHSPNEPAHEAAVAELLLQKGARTIEASAYLDLTPPVVRYRLAGLSRGADGQVIARNRVIAKVSRVEVAAKFLSPAPQRIVQELLTRGQVTAEQAELAVRMPMCDDLTAEADSGGHTDNRPAIALLPTMLALRDRVQREHRYPQPVRVGLAGGIATPAGVAAAFAMGAAYVVTGSINQACVESGSSDPVRKMLAEAGQADVIMAPAADMFEMGVKVQVLKRGTMFAMRAQKLYELYRQYPSWEAIPGPERAQVEKNLLRVGFAEVWEQTRAFFERRDPTQLPKADADPRHKMALVFRWYLGLSSRWANAGEPTRQVDYQVWCGPAMGAFNEWARGSFLEQPANRGVVVVALNLLTGACIHLRRQAVRQQGVDLPADWFDTGPAEMNELKRRLG
jgi:PfaD family protein